MNNELLQGKLKYIEAKLNEYIYSLKAKCLFIADTKGQIISTCSKEDVFSKFLISSLAINSLHSMKSFKDNLGQKDVQSLLFQAKNENGYFVLLSDSSVLGVIFADNVPSGYIRLKVKKLIEEINEILYVKLNEEDPFFDFSSSFWDNAKEV